MKTEYCSHRCYSERDLDVHYSNQVDAEVHPYRLVRGNHLHVESHLSDIGPQVARRNAEDLRSMAADRGYDGKPFRDNLRADCIHPRSGAQRPESSRWYNRRWMVEIVFSSIKRTHGGVERARSWHLEFREMVLKCAVYNVRRTVRNP